ncbi:MAG: serine/threonine protein kinase [Planctomycetes bacterium]|nr:serine/threonine protein kinase [Planctomycetota bacterium]
MPEQPTVIPGLNDADTVWDLLAERINALVTAWDSAGIEPELVQFAPDGPPPVRRLGLIELVKVDMDYRHRRGISGWGVEDYLGRFPELADGGVPCDLVYEEFHLRKQAGEPVIAADFLARFPQQADQLRRLLGLDGAERTTSLFAPVVSAPLSVGETIDDFDLLTELGSGAFATVFLARQRSLQRLVALKTSANAGTEPQTLAQLEHPHIVRVYDQRYDAERDLRLLYMQYVAGGTLQDVVKQARATSPAQRSGRIVLAAVDAALDKAGQSAEQSSSTRQSLASCSWPEAVCRIGMQLGSALHYAHRRGVLHRDLKPANVLMTPEGAPRLADFNISFCSKLDGATPAAYFGGSLAYMSPEQLEACSPMHDRQPEELDGRSDIYSLGVVLWELLCGQRPYADEPLESGWNDTLEAMLKRRRAGISAAQIAKLGDLPPGLSEALLACLQPNREDRPANGAEIETRLRLCLRPDAQRLMAPARGWRAIAQRWPTTAIVLVALLSNVPAAAFNTAYNVPEVVPPNAMRTFWMVQIGINAVAFPIGIFVLVFLTRPVRRALAASNLAAGTDTSDARKRALAMGHIVALVGIVEWIVAGILYPTLMHLAGEPLEASHYMHFMASLALCGMIAATYPFFGVTFLSVRAFYPRLLPSEPPGEPDHVALTRLSRRTWGYLILAASLPLLAVVVLVLIGSAHGRPILGILSAGSLLGFGLIFYLARTIQADLASLSWIVQPKSDADAGDTGSFLV